MGKITGFLRFGRPTALAAAAFLAVPLIATPALAAGGAAAIVIHFTGPNGATRAGVISNGPNTRFFDMAECQVQLKTNLAKLIRQTRAQPQFAGMKPAAAECRSYADAQRFLR